MYGAAAYERQLLMFWCAILQYLGLLFGTTPSSNLLRPWYMNKVVLSSWLQCNKKKVLSHTSSPAFDFHISLIMSLKKSQGPYLATMYPCQFIFILLTLDFKVQPLPNTLLHLFALLFFIYSKRPPGFFEGGPFYYLHTIYTQLKVEYCRISRRISFQILLLQLLFDNNSLNELKSANLVCGADLL